MDETESYFKEEISKMCKLLKELNNKKNLINNKLAYSVIKLQEMNLELKTLLESLDNDNNKLTIEKYVKNEFIRRDKISELMPIFMYIYMSSN